MTAIPELRTERLLLRPFQPEDVADGLAYRNDLEFARFLPHVPQPFTRQDAETWVWVNMTESPQCSVTFAVVLGSTVIGTTNIERAPQGRIAMLGYAIGRKWWRQGIATEAARAVAAWASAEFRLSRLWGVDRRAQSSVSARAREIGHAAQSSARRASSRSRGGTSGRGGVSVEHRRVNARCDSSPASQDPVGISESRYRVVTFTTPRLPLSVNGVLKPSCAASPQAMRSSLGTKTTQKSWKTRSRSANERSETRTGETGKLLFHPLSTDAKRHAQITAKKLN